MEQQFNTVLIPPHNIALAAINFAQNNFANNHDGYCLGSDGHLPHITLAQTTISNPEQCILLNNLVSKLQWHENTSVKLDEYYHHLDRGYCGLSVNPSESLTTIHNHIVTIHEELNLPIHSGHSKNYWPHMTFAKTNHGINEPVDIPNILRSISHGWSLEFGHMGDHGVYLGKYES